MWLARPSCIPSSPPSFPHVQVFAVARDRRLGGVLLTEVTQTFAAAGGPQAVLDAIVGSGGGIAIPLLNVRHCPAARFAPFVLHLIKTLGARVEPRDTSVLQWSAHAFVVVCVSVWVSVCLAEHRLSVSHSYACLWLCVSVFVFGITFLLGRAEAVGAGVCPGPALQRPLPEHPRDAVPGRSLRPPAVSQGASAAGHQHGLSGG